MPEQRPLLTVFGGANGAGKSTLAAAFGLPGRFVNADEVARRINPACPDQASVSAGRRVLADLDRGIAARDDLVYETTLSSHQSLSLIRHALAAGYEVGLVFVLLRHPDLNVARVGQRVALGGHAIPEPLIRRRCRTALDRLAQAAAVAHGVLVYDNSGRDGPALVWQGRRGQADIDRLDRALSVHAATLAAVTAASAAGTKSRAAI